MLGLGYSITKTKSSKSYKEAIALNVNTAGGPLVGGNFNEPEFDFSTPGTIVSDAISLLTGSPTSRSISYLELSATTNGASGDVLSSSKNFPANTYDRFIQASDGNAAVVVLSSIFDLTEVKATIALINPAGMSTFNGRMYYYEGFSIVEIPFVANGPKEVSFVYPKGASNDMEIYIEASAGASNGIGICGVKYEFNPPISKRTLSTGQTRTVSTGQERTIDES